MRNRSVFFRLLSSTLIVAACTPGINQNTSIVIQPSSTQIPQSKADATFAALGGAGLDPTVIQHCSGKDITGNQGYATGISHRYRRYLKQLSGRLHGQYGGLGQGTPVSLPSSLASPTAFPSASSTSDISVVEKTSINGDINDEKGQAMQSGQVMVRSLNSSIPFTATSSISGGTYSFNNVPTGVQLEIVVVADGYEARTRTVVAKSNKTGDPDGNKYDFGNVDGNGEVDTRTALSTRPEVTRAWSLRSSASDPLEGVGLRFSKAMQRDSIENSFGAYIKPEISWMVPTERVLTANDFSYTWNEDDSAVEIRFKQGSLAPGFLEKWAFGFEEGQSTLFAKDGTLRESGFFKPTAGNFEEVLIQERYINRFADDINMAPIPPIPTPFPTQSPRPTPISTPTPTPTPVPTASLLPPPTKARDFYYFSYDDSASVSGVELTRHALDSQQLPDPAWARPWEFLNYENFDHLNQEKVGDFLISLGLWRYRDPENPLLERYEVGAHVTAPYRCPQTRPLLNLTLLVDASNSMTEGSSFAVPEGGKIPSKLELVKSGLSDLYTRLRKGDIVTIVIFSEKAFTALDAHTIGEDSEAEYQSAINQIMPLTNTDMQAGLDAGYRAARQHFSESRLNRLMILTDAKPTAGELNLKLVREMAQQADAQGIYLSALGIGFNQNQPLLNELTEAGKGAYYAINTRSDIKEAMGDRLLPLLDVIARNMRFRIEFPGWLRHGQSAAEQRSQNAADVQSTHFSANTSQYFWEQFRANQGDYQGNQTVRLILSYQDPLNGAQREVAIEKSLDQMLNQDVANIQAAHLIQLTTGLIRQQVSAEQVNQTLNSLLPE